VEVAIRKYEVGEEKILRELFFQTIHEVNTRDYTEEQVNAWAPIDYEMNHWVTHFVETQPYVALVSNEIAGYADVQDDGYIDHFFCHSKFQGQGVGAALMKTLFHEGMRLGIKRFYSQVSITAKPFFEKHGFKELKQQRVCIRGVNLTNYLMERYRD
jgi:putative acetyltransferase